MNIDPVNNEGFVYSPQSKTQKQQIEQKYTQTDDRIRQRGDSLVLSDEAKKLKPILAKLKSGVYDSPEVLREVARRISNQFPPPSKEQNS